MVKHEFRLVEFIIEAIRELRPKRRGLKPDTSTGASIKKLFKHTKELFSEAQFKNGLQYLINNGEIVIVAFVKEHKAGNAKPTSRYQVITKIPKRIKFETAWRWDSSGSIPENQQNRDNFYARNIVVYVKEDGLPQSAVDAERRSYSPTVRRIIDRIKAKKEEQKKE